MILNGVSTDWLVAVVRPLVERSTVGHLYLGVGQASVSRHGGSRSVIEADRQRVLERVVEKLCSVSRHDLEALLAPDESVFPEYVILRPPRQNNIGRIGPEIRIGVVPERAGGTFRWRR